MTIFYDPYIDLPALEQELAAYVPDAKERAEILDILDASLHHVAMEVILTALPQDQHELFLLRFRENPEAPEHLDYLRQYHPTIEEAIQSAALDSKRQFIDTIHAG